MKFLLMRGGQVNYSEALHPQAQRASVVVQTAEKDAPNAESGEATGGLPLEGWTLDLERLEDLVAFASELHGEVQVRPPVGGFTVGGTVLPVIDVARGD
ncbi:hypothetical protein HNR42_002977 [Deinobacterium chartae]|uniref:Uncharacterized protein n=1 Tax=Deinobacterium chartae TaxID=521158 RepID=A0A841I1G1_9DEIO|nr:hypothetical protein [Deinobacterium chartae]MBB6099527.1 hypothetical protein [Deinobacterium chartae]